MSATRFESEIVRLRLPGLIFARYGHAGLARRATQPDPDWQKTLDGPDLNRYIWITFADDEFPRAIGMRITTSIAQTQTFEVVEWYAPNRIVRGQWRLRPLGRWSYRPTSPSAVSSEYAQPERGLFTWCTHSFPHEQTRNSD